MEVITDVNDRKSGLHYEVAVSYKGYRFVLHTEKHPDGTMYTTFNSRNSETNRFVYTACFHDCYMEDRTKVKEFFKTQIKMFMENKKNV